MKISIALIALMLPEVLLATDANENGHGKPESRTTTLGHECAVLEQAHANLLAGCFSAQRQIQVAVNKRQRLRERAQIDYVAGEWRIDLQEKESLDDKFILDSEEGDMAISVPFACDRLRRNEQGRFELEAPDDPEIVVFDYDADNSVLLPLSWNFDANERFLFKKFHIQAQAIYSNLSYSPCETATDAD